MTNRPDFEGGEAKNGILKPFGSVPDIPDHEVFDHLRPKTKRSLEVPVQSMTDKFGSCASTNVQCLEGNKGGYDPIVWRTIPLASKCHKWNLRYFIFFQVKT